MRTQLVIASFALALGSLAQNTLIIDFQLNKPKAGGTLRVAICSTADAFTSGTGCVLKEVPASGDVVCVKVEPLPIGACAVKVFHDVNNNGKLDTNWMGIPTEPYGFSNDAMGTFGPPSFEQARVMVGAGTSIRIKMKG